MRFRGAKIWHSWCIVAGRGIKTGGFVIEMIRRRCFYIFFIFSIILLTRASHAVVWTDTETWSDAWEEKYSDWVKNSFNEEIFVKGKYSGISTDCAHAVYLARVLFAFENKLPFVIKDSTGGSIKVTNRMGRWDGQSELSRVKNFAGYLGEMVSTKTLPNDSYPVKIDRQFLKSGAIWSRVRITEENIFRRLFGLNVEADPGHAELVKNVDEAGVVTLIGSTVPKDIRKLITTSSLVFMPIEKSTGFRKWMQPGDYGKDVSKLPGFSLEQYDMGKVERRSYRGGRNGNDSNITERRLDAWAREVQGKLALREETKEEYLQRGVLNFCALASARVEAVSDGEALRLRQKGSCMTASDYDAYSTPSRDKRIKETLEGVKAAAGIGGFLRSNSLDPLEKYFAPCAVLQISKEKQLSAFSYAKLVNDDNYSSDPNDTLEARWGLEMSARRMCPTHD